MPVLGATLLIGISGCATEASAPSAAGNDDIHKIKHVVAVLQENRSFDSYFGTFPGADGIPMRDGQPTACVPEPVPVGLGPGIANAFLPVEIQYEHQP
jgi:phospholipase C